MAEERDAALALIRETLAMGEIDPSRAEELIGEALAAAATDEERAAIEWLAAADGNYHEVVESALAAIEHGEPAG